MSRKQLPSRSRPQHGIGPPRGTSAWEGEIVMEADVCRWTVALLDRGGRFEGLRELYSDLSQG